MVIRTATRLAVGLLATHSLILALTSMLWWAFDSGPLAGDPDLVLTGPTTGAVVRVFGDHPGLDPVAAARRTVEALDAAGGFDRSVLVVTIPTGSGWVDPDQVTAVENWAGGDVATVAMRYSSAPSAAVYALRPGLAAESARAILAEVTGRIRSLPPQQRPHLVVHGLSLGAQAGAAALTDPGIAELVDAVLWQGPPGADAVEQAVSRALDSGAASSVHDCTVTVVNPDDPVAELTWGLLLEPSRAIRVLATLPGSDSEAPGVGHRYRPVTPPPECVSPGA